MNPLLQVDIYKVSHEGFMPKGTNKIYANFTPRSSKYLPVLKDRYDDKVVVFSIQHFTKDFLIKAFNEEFFNKPKDKVIDYFKRIMCAHLGVDAVDTTRFEALHDLGYLPIEIKALPEGSLVNIKVPVLTITNTHPDYAWLTNYLETVMSQELWKPMTTATIIREYRKLVNEFALKTTGSLAGTEFQLHDFSARGLSGRHDSAINGVAFLLSSNGTDTIAAVEVAEKSYNADVTKEFIGCSIPASEHSVSCLGTAVDGELESYRKWITKDYPTGLVSLVSDTYDYWRVLTEYLPALKADILARPVNAIGLSKVVIRPDSGNPADIICGKTNALVYDSLDDAKEDLQAEASEYLSDSIFEEDVEYTIYNKEDNKYYCLLFKGEIIKERGSYSDHNYYTLDKTYLSRCDQIELSPEQKGSIELLWETFGGTVTEQGYKVLDSHIGLIYGDSITLEVAEEVFKRLEAKGFASTNVVFGVGSYTMQYLTRDSLGLAVKATYAEVCGVGYELFKDPITDSGMKKSAKGLLRVEQEGSNFVLYDQQTKEQEQQGALQTVFKDGKLVTETSLTEIRNRLWG